jgi:aspartyl-tRNA(Asn)/glutamyl-tRNA(Gln) amidotransferase subunit C
MEMDDQHFDKLALLCRLNFPPEEKEAIKTDLLKMILFVDKLKELQLGDIHPKLLMGEVNNIFREDLPGKPFSSSMALKQAPEADVHFFKVPKVIRKN